jgi:hypothetical protein
VDVYGLRFVQWGQVLRVVAKSVFTLVAASLGTWPHWTDRNPYTSTIQILLVVASEVTTTP